MGNDVITLLDEEFENGTNGEKVHGITVIIDGKLKAVMDKLIETNSACSNYTDVVQNALIEGINALIKASK